MNQKNTGAYYTPKILSDFLADHIMKKYIADIDLSILEPSCGDGKFIQSFFENLNSEKQYNVNIDILDINNTELEKAKEFVPNRKNFIANYYCQDYLKFFLDNNKSYSLIIGNPPYIKKGNLKKEQIEICELVHQKAKIYSSEINSTGSIKNIWTAFIEAAVMSLNDNGVLCFVIPAEILQVKYAKELRDSISQEFDRVEVFAFNELIFEGIQQDVVAIIGVKGIQDVNEHGFSFYQVDTLEDLKEPKFTEKHSNIHRTTLDKWTNYILSDDELNFVSKLRNQLQRITTYAEKAQVGIVSAANDYFILNNEKVKEHNLNRLKNIIKPILPKGYVVQRMILFGNDDYNNLEKANKNVNFLHFPNKSKSEFGSIENDYFNHGEEIKNDNKGELHKRYKMLKRDNWYHVPSVWLSEGLFIKRSHLYPKMIVNNAKVLATDSFYRVNAKKEFCIKKIVFSFYNSLTFILAELEGRFYGGGVLELTPNEFKNLSIPYSQSITEAQIIELDKMLRNGCEIKDVLKFTNAILLPGIDVERLEIIRNNLVNRRIKKKNSKTKIFDLLDTKLKRHSKTAIV